MTTRPDVLIRGAGVIGLSLALELRARGYRVAVVDPGRALAQASTAAAGMLAVEDPHNPPELLSLARLSRTLYPEFLAKIEALSGMQVPWQTHTTNQLLSDGCALRLRELSIDPRQLAPALLQAILKEGVELIPESTAASGAGIVMYTSGAWAQGDLPVSPCKGQMLRVRLPFGLELTEVFRSQHVYVVPRTQGPQAGTALIGATVEDAGFDRSTSPEDLRQLRNLAARLVPEIADEENAITVEAWAGLRPATPDGLPVLGEWPAGNRQGRQPKTFVATGHFRNGILLAPATARVMAELLAGGQPSVELQAFSAARFSATLA